MADGHREESVRAPKVTHGLEYAALRAALALVDRMPIAALPAFARGVAWAWFCLNPRRRRNARENVRRSGIAQSRSDANRIVRRSFEHFAIVAVESLRRTRVPAQTRMDIPPETMAVLREPGRGLILVSGHLGNWEIAARALSAIKPVLGIARPMNNPLAEALLRARLDSANIEWTAKHAADAGRLLGAVRGGKLLALLIDQHARDRGMPIDFFGAPAWTHTSPALLHLVTGAPLVFGFCWRTGPMSYAIEALKPIFHAPTGNKEHDIRAILARLTRELETAIRAHPEQYLWVHRRWKAPSQWPAAGTR